VLADGVDDGAAGADVEDAEDAEDDPQPTASSVRQAAPAAV
jgi:hypothetical protein